MGFVKNFIPAFQGRLSKMKDGKKKNYIMMMDTGLVKFSKEISLRPADFAKNLKANAVVVKMKRMPTSPSDLAEKQKCEKFPTVLDVLVNACAFIGDEMASHPSLRKLVLEKYLKGIRISTIPTEKGEKELDCFHP